MSLRFMNNRVVQIVILVASIYLIYSPILIYTFDYHDSFYVFAYSDHSVCSHHPQYASFIFFGRPLYAFVNCLVVAQLIDTLQDATLVRWIALMIISGVAVWFYHILRFHKLADLIALVTSILVFILPGVQFITYLTQATPIIYAFPAIFLAYYLFNTFMLSLETRAKWRSGIMLAGCIVLLIVASTIYQQLTPLFFVLVFLSIFKMTYVERSIMRRYISGSILAFILHGVV
jgi:hypothetical protein